MGRPPGLICALVLVLSTAACSSAAGEQAAEDQRGGVALPESAYPPHIQCHLDHGWTLERADGDRFELSIPADLHSDEEHQRISEECRQLRPEEPELTDEDVREIYERWMVEADCLRELGYEPDPAPPFEVFLADWHGTGPWSPLHGVDTGSWTRDVYEEAKHACGLDHFGMGF